MNEERLNELLNKIYYEYLDSHEAEEFIIYFKRLKQDKDNLQSKIDKAIEVIDLITPELWNISNKMTYRLKDVKNILKEDE